MTGLAEPSKFT